ncbi:glycosyltransferase [Mycolicibacterium vaccae]|uniref:glycosyltransferase n=1 Tax=Mycolicibacterium vaccae TaxID=1810 RepID=UPI003CFE208D
MFDNPVPGRQLLIASTGGHLAQLVKWAPQIGAESDSLWVTFRSPQSDSLLEGRRVLHVPYVPPRGVRQAAKAFTVMMREIDWRAENFTTAMSTGAAVALPGLGAARIHRVPSFYFESVSRVNGPSLTGKLLAFDPWTRKSCQYQHWANKRWTYRGSLFDNYSTIERLGSQRPSLFVTLGTIRPYRFDAMVDAILATGLADERTVWQLGETSRDDLPGYAETQFSREKFEKYARNADVVITHSGVGTIMELLDMGIFPVVVPRRAKRGEHVDDHQLQVAKILTEREIALVAEVEDLDRGAILQASNRAMTKGEQVLGHLPPQ